MRAIIDLTEAGYGQVALRGKTSEGHAAEIKKGQFYDDKDKNLQSLNRPKEIRVTLDTDGMTDRAVQRSVATILLKFYGEG